MIRHPDWRSRLNAELAASQRRPFAWGSNDCALFAMRCVEAMTGQDKATAFRGRYRTARGALMAIRRAGCRDLLGLASLHFEKIPVAMANTGDVAAVFTELGVALGIVGSDRIHVMRADGLGTISRSAAVAAFRV